MTVFTVSSGSVSSGLLLSLNDELQVLSGGQAVATELTSGASMVVSNGGVANQTSVDSTGGIIDVLGGSIISTTFAGSGFLNMSSGGTAIVTKLGSGTVMTVSYGAVAQATTVGAYSVLSNQEGVVSNTQVLSGGLEQDSFAGVSSNTIVLPGGEQYVDNSAIAFNTEVKSGAVEVIIGGALASGTQVSSGGKLIVLSEGSAIGTDVHTGGSVQSGGIIELRGDYVVSAIVGSSDNLNFKGVSAFVLSGGVVNAGTISYASVTVGSSGLTVGASVFGGGVEIVFAGGTASATQIAWNMVSSGDLSEAGTLSVLSGGAAYDTTLGSPPVGVFVASSAELYVASGSVVNSTTINAGGVMFLSGGAEPVSTLINSGGQLDLLDFAYDARGAATFNETDDALSVIENGMTISLSLGDEQAGLFFHLASDTTGGTLVSADTSPCFCRGTKIATPAGEINVEDLEIDDVVLTTEGYQNIAWIGRRRYTGSAVNAPGVLPIHFAAGSLGEGLPKRPLYVSPEHAMLLDNVLVPARALVDGKLISRVTHADEVAYYHLELSHHSIIFAEGAATESYFDDSNRHMFQNATDYPASYAKQIGDRHRGYCAPRVDSGLALETLRSRLPSSPDCIVQGHLRGFIDHISRDKIIGWAFVDDSPTGRQRLRILVDGATVGNVLAAEYRSDLAEAGIGDGNHGFSFDIPGGLNESGPHMVEVVREADCSPLINSPYVYQTIQCEVEERVLGSLQGSVDTVTRWRVSGWAYNWSEHSRPVALQLVINGVLAASTVANGWRPDVAASGLCDGRCGFDISIPGGLSPAHQHVVEVRRASDGQRLGSLKLFETSKFFDQEMQTTVKNTLSALDSDHARVMAISYLDERINELREQLSDRSRQCVKHVSQGRSAYNGKSIETPIRSRCIVIDPRYPACGRDAGSDALLSHMQALMELGYSVSFLASEEIESSAEDLESIGIHCFRLPSYSSVEDLLKRQAGCFDVVYLHRIASASAYLALARKYNPGATLVYSVADLHHVRLHRQASLEGRLDLAQESRRVKIAEIAAAALSDCVITHSPVEAELLRDQSSCARVAVVPWAVKQKARRAGYSKRRGIMFIGNYNHAPNRDALSFLIREIMPAVWECDESIHLFASGGDMPADIHRLTGQQITVLGRVDDLESIMSRIRLTVAPLRFGSGLKGKVVSSLSAGVPCIMSPVAAEGFLLPELLRKLIGEDAQAMASLIVRLYSNRREYQAAAGTALAYAREAFSSDRVREAMKEALVAPMDREQAKSLHRKELSAMSPKAA